MNQFKFPSGKKFAFTIIDDTDDATLENVKPVYDLLYEKGIITTKTVWVYPPRDKPSSGDSLQRPDYLNFIIDLKNKGFEIALHNVGSGDYKKEEVLKGLNEYKEKLGEYPKIHINHSYNPDSIYGGYKRFNFPFNKIVKTLYPQYSGQFKGEEVGSDYFWGDKHKETIKFSRNHEIDELNVSKFDPYMPYIDPQRSKYANYWFSAAFAPNQWVYNRLVSMKNIDRLEKEGGICIIFTHFGYFMKDGKVDEQFVETLDYLSNKNGLFVPVSTLLEEIMSQREKAGIPIAPKLPYYKKFVMEFKHLFTRFKFRKFIKLDDYAFKNLNKEMFK